jgi:UDPglucose 6-dehydrogenase
MWNPLYGTRGGVPYGGACLPKDTVAFMQFAREHGFEHLMLEATIAVNEQLQEAVPAVPDPSKIDEVLEAVKLRDQAAAEGKELTIELGSTETVVL